MCRQYIYINTQKVVLTRRLYRLGQRPDHSISQINEAITGEVRVDAAR